jgi:hypothetical protein
MCWFSRIALLGTLLGILWAFAFLTIAAGAKANHLEPTSHHPTPPWRKLQADSTLPGKSKDDFLIRRVCLVWLEEENLWQVGNLVHNNDVQVENTGEQAFDEATGNYCHFFRQGKQWEVEPFYLLQRPLVAKTPLQDDYLPVPLPETREPAASIDICLATPVQSEGLVAGELKNDGCYLPDGSVQPAEFMLGFRVALEPGWRSTLHDAAYKLGMMLLMAGGGVALVMVGSLCAILACIYGEKLHRRIDPDAYRKHQ